MIEALLLPPHFLLFIHQLIIQPRKDLKIRLTAVSHAYTQMSTKQIYLEELVLESVKLKDMKQRKMSAYISQIEKTSPTLEF